MVEEDQKQAIHKPFSHIANPRMWKELWKIDCYEKKKEFHMEILPNALPIFQNLKKKQIIQED